MRWSQKLVVGLLLVLAAGGAAWVLRDRLRLEAWVERETLLRSLVEQHALLAPVGAGLVYIAVTGLSIPGAAGLTLLLAWLFGFWRALVLVSFASTAGATLAFLSSRYLLGNWVQRFRQRLGPRWNQALEEDSAYLLFTLRLVPVVPFFAVNLLMGLTPLSVARFWWVSQLSMAPGTVAYVYLGASVPSLGHLADPARLRPDDVRDAAGLARRLRVRGPLGQPSPERQVWLLLPGELQRQILDAPEADWTSQRGDLATGLNACLPRAELYDGQAWQQAALCARDRQLLAENTLSPRERTALNRRLLSAAFPRELAPQKPWFPPQLALALALVGLAPWGLRRLVAKASARRWHAAKG